MPPELRDDFFIPSAGIIPIYYSIVDPAVPVVWNAAWVARILEQGALFRIAIERRAEFEKLWQQHEFEWSPYFQYDGHAGAVYFADVGKDKGK